MKMRKIASALLGIGFFSATAVAQVPPQFWNNAPENPVARIQTLRERIDQSFAQGLIDRGEAHHAKGELNHTFAWIHQMHYEDGGNLSPDQRAQIQVRIDQIAQEVHWDRTQYRY